MSFRFFVAIAALAATAACSPSTVCRDRGFVPGSQAYENCVQSEVASQRYNYDNLGSHPNP
jgi:hypothetical protein